MEPNKRLWDTSAAYQKAQLQWEIALEREEQNHNGESTKWQYQVQFYFKKGKGSSKKGRYLFFFPPDFILLSRIPQGMCDVDSAVVAVLRALNQGRAFNSLGHSEHRGPGGFRDMKH